MIAEPQDLPSASCGLKEYLNLTVHRIVKYEARAKRRLICEQPPINVVRCCFNSESISHAKFARAGIEQPDLCTVDEFADCEWAEATFISINYVSGAPGIELRVFHNRE